MSRTSAEETERRVHEKWLGMVQPIEGLVVSVPVLVDAQCAQRNAPALQHRLLELTTAPEKERPVGKRRASAAPAPRAVADLGQFLTEMLRLDRELFDVGGDVSEDLSLYVPEGGQTLRPTLALRKQREGDVKAPDALTDDSTPASRAGAKYEMLVWDLCAAQGERPPAPCGLSLDKAEALTGPWEYPPTAKFVRLLRACHVPIGLLTNRTEFRLIYAPHGQASGHLTFKVDDMAVPSGRPVLDAFVMLLSVERFFGVRLEHQLPQLLQASRLRQADCR